MNEQELQALKQVRAWIDTLELHGQAVNDNAYFTRANDLWRVFAGVALLHGITTQQAIDLTADKK
jgi:hypothetical protein